jgi:formate hydrogenlyase subunit 6/NADH:ubiquinone oxidoreductase subunit I
MEVMQIKKKALYDLVDSLIRKKQEVVSVVPKEARCAYAVLSSSKDMTLDYEETILPPKKYFLPVKETLLTYQAGDPASCQAVCDDKPRVIFGMHPGDCAAIALLDRSMKEANNDPQYQKRRENTTVVGIHYSRPYPYRFTSSMVTQGEAYLSADAMLTDLKDGSYAVELVTDKGKKLFAKSKAKKATEAVTKKMEKAKIAVKDKIKLKMDVHEVPKFLEGKEKHPVYDNRVTRCYSCGSCVLVCPTCYCFNVADELELSMKKGTRSRTWDGCMLQDFAEVAGGHNFRKKPEDRFRHRLFRKTKYLLERFGVPGCVGCGRCGHACITKIASPAETLNEMMK